MIYFIGAGPGDPELITVKGKRLIDEADIIIYAGSLVNPQVLSGARPEAEIYNSATMNLEEVLDVMKRGVAAGKKVVRVHTGDPSIYGAHREQIEALAAHQATMVIFLSVGEIETLSTRLQAGGYPEDTPAAVVYKASWEDQKIVKGTLTDIAQKVKEAGIRKTALVTVGRFLGDTFELSRLYDAHFTTEFRKGV